MTKTLDNEHILYEMMMLGSAVNSWLQLKPSAEAQMAVNFYTIVGFNSAANLIDLMIEREIKVGSIIRKYRRLIEEQIRTLTPKRTAKMGDKLALAEMKALFSYVYARADRIGVELPPLVNSQLADIAEACNAEIDI